MSCDGHTGFYESSGGPVGKTRYQETRSSWTGQLEDHFGELGRRKEEKANRVSVSGSFSTGSRWHPALGHLGRGHLGRSTERVWGQGRSRRTLTLPTLGKGGLRNRRPRRCAQADTLKVTSCPGDLERDKVSGDPELSLCPPAITGGVGKAATGLVVRADVR